VYIALHIIPFTAIWTGASWFDAGLCFALLYVRGFCMSAGYHRYFSHRSFKTSRVMQLLLAVGGCMALKGGPLWWSALHRHHHLYSDTPEDAHSPAQGFWWSYGGWLVSGRFDQTRYEFVKDLAQYPELRWLNRNWLVPPAALAVLTLVLGGWSTFAIGFCLSSALLYHTQAALDSLVHLIGFRRYATPDTSRNSVVLSLLCLGEGWHNNHHHYPTASNEGFFWWEVDTTYDILRLLALVGLVWDLRTPPESVLRRNLVRDQGANGEGQEVPIPPPAPDELVRIVPEEEGFEEPAEAPTTVGR
jgi:stearoyl-CoA desaturase (delta-9 desaturase)